MTKCEYTHGYTWPSVNWKTGVLEQGWLSIWKYMTKWEYQTQEHMTKSKYQLGYIWPPTENSNTKIHDNTIQKLIKYKYNAGYMTESEYQLGDTWASTDRNSGIHDRVWISNWGAMTKSDYENWDTWPNASISMGTNNQVYQHGYALASVNINTGTHDYVSVSTEGYMTNWGCKHGDTWLGVNIIMSPYIWPSENRNMGTHDQA